VVVPRSELVATIRKILAAQNLESDA
jgi:hypothetical protein